MWFRSNYRSNCKRFGAIKKIYLTEWAKGKESEVIDLCFVGRDLNKIYLLKLLKQKI